MQGKKILLAAAAGLATLSMATSAFAVMSVSNGWYLEANAGSTHLSNKSYPGSASSSGVGGNANLGYKFMPYVAAEIGYTQYANTSITTPNGTKAALDKHYSYDIAVKGIVPIGTTGLEPFAKLGAQHLSSSVGIVNTPAAALINISSSSHNTVNVYMGAGAQYYFMPELAAVVQWQRSQGTRNGTGTLDLYSAGISFIAD